MNQYYDLLVHLIETRTHQKVSRNRALVVDLAWFAMVTGGINFINMRRPKIVDSNCYSRQLLLTISKIVTMAIAIHVDYI